MCKYGGEIKPIFVNPYKKQALRIIAKTCFLCIITLPYQIVTDQTVYPLLPDDTDVLSLSVPFPYVRPA